MSKQESTTTLNEELLDMFSRKLESTINSVCEKYPNLDPRAELLVTLSLFSAQVSIDSGYNKKEFLALMGEMYDDFESEEPSSNESSNEVDISKFN